MQKPSLWADHLINRFGDQVSKPSIQVSAYTQLGDAAHQLINIYIYTDNPVPWVHLRFKVIILFLIAATLSNRAPNNSCHSKPRTKQTMYHSNIQAQILFSPRWFC